MKRERRMKRIENKAVASIFGIPDSRFIPLLNRKLATYSYVLTLFEATVYILYGFKIG